MTWTQGWRERLWNQMDQSWDLIVIGGGITGAGILREAVHAGLKVLLLEARDFSYGTSSRSSKLIHGGFRYLRNRQFGVTYESVREREWMLREAEKLVTPLRFLVPNYELFHTADWVFHLGVILYDLFAPKWNHRVYGREPLLEMAPYLSSTGLSKGFDYYDAEMDDSRLVLRLIQEAVKSGGAAINYARVEDFLRTADGDVCGVRVRDMAEATGSEKELKAKVVINATGPWGDEVRSKIGQEERLRKQRGSHLIFEREKFPLPVAVTLLHPKDRRAMFAFPWEGVTVIGTTDLDHPGSIDEPRATETEIAYIMEALQVVFPSFGLTYDDVIATYSGLRPIVRSGKSDPSAESRAHVVWEENGLITISGGKITTFRIMAREALKAAAKRLPGNPVFPTRQRMFNPLQDALNPELTQYLAGRYGQESCGLLEAAQTGELKTIKALPNCWAEIRWAARSEGVVHLDDLLMRRVRLGLLLPQGGQECLPQIRAIVQPELGWDDARWQAEVTTYGQIWQDNFSPNPAVK